MTRVELAELAAVSPAMVARIELQGHIPSALALSRIAKALGVSVDDLLPKVA